MIAKASLVIRNVQPVRKAGALQILLLPLALAGQMAGAATSQTADANPARGVLQNSVNEQKQAEQNRSTLRDRLRDLQQSLSVTSRQHAEASQQLADTEARISELTRSLADLKARQADIEQQLTGITAQQTTQQALADSQKKQLAALLRHEYGAGREDRLKLLLSADDPNRINRELAYAGYLSQAQANLLASLKNRLQQLATLRAGQETAQAELAQTINSQQRDATELGKDQASRTALLEQLAGKLADQQDQAANAVREEKDLSTLITALGNKIQAEQAEAERIRQERLKAQRLQQQETEKARQLAAEQAAAAKKVVAERASLQKKLPQTIISPAAGKPVFQEIPEDNGLSSAEQNARPDSRPPDSRPAGSPVTGYDGSGLAPLRGKMSLPVNGEITTKFGAARGGSTASRGIFIKAAEGSNIAAIADGKVLYSDYLRGLGNMTIIDHGGQYLSVYAGNQANLKHPGDIVRRGDTIAQAGSTGGNEQSGLYFEIRHEGRAIDPLLWVTTR